MRTATLEVDSAEGAKEVLSRNPGSRRHRNTGEFKEFCRAVVETDRH